MNETMRDRERLAELLDRYGADFALWPDSEASVWARRVVMADLEARSLWEEARRLDDMLAGSAARLDAEIERSGMSERVVGAVAQALPPARPPARVWVPRIAAAFFVAVAFGGLSDRLLWGELGGGQDAVAVDLLLFGPGETEFE